MLRRVALRRPAPPCAPRRLVSTPTGPSSAAAPAPESKAMFIGGIIVFGGILQRYWWKSELLAEREKALEQPPVELPSTNEGQLSVLFHKVTVDGVYDYDRQVFVGPRGPPKDAPQSVARSGNTVGFYVVTPLVRGEGKGTVLVNRGWVPRPLIEKGDESVNGAKGAVVHVAGVARSGEQPRAIMGSGTEYRDQVASFELTALADAAGVPDAACIVDAVEPFVPRQFPITKQLPAFAQFEVMPSMHLIYTATWYTLAACGIVMTYLRFRKAPVPKRKPLKI